MELVYLLFLILLGSNFSSNEVNGKGAEKILGGNPSYKGRFKYVVPIMYESPGYDDQNVCVGAIVNDFSIVTVAHCFYDNLFGEWRTKRYYIAVGVQNWKTQLDTMRKIYVYKVIIHDTYNPNMPDNYLSRGNLAVIKLNESLECRPDHPKLSRLTVRNFHLDHYSGSFHVIGYGFTEIQLVEEEIFGESKLEQKGYTDGRLRFINTKILTYEQCRNIIKDDIPPGNICAKAIKPEYINRPVGICKYDSGAPLTHKGFLDGIAINGFITCDEDVMPGIYIDVIYYYRFIDDAMKNHRTSDMVVLKQVFNTSNTGLNKYGFEQI